MAPIICPAAGGYNTWRPYNQPMARHILGLSAYYHDSAAALLRDGRIIAAAQEERFSRQKHDAAFPARAIAYCLAEAGIGLGDVESIAFYDKPLLKFERLLETYVSYAPRGFRSFAAAMPVWLKDKLYLKQTLRRELSIVGDVSKRALPPLLFSEHHRSHAASAFFPSPYRRAAVLCLDGVGEWATTTTWRGSDNQLQALWQIDFPHSLGLLYSAFTYFTGFRVNSGEYKLMGLAPYGEPRYVDVILDQLLDLKDDGTFRLNMDYFDYCTGLEMTNRRFDALFEGPRRQPEGPITEREMDLAASIQTVTEEAVLRLSRALHAETGERRLCLAGGVALNCVANGRVQREGPFDDIWVQPAAGDAGGAVGAAFAVWHEYEAQPRSAADQDQMAGALLGPRFDNDQVASRLTALAAVYERLDEIELLERVATLLAQGDVVGWFQGRMEFGPRALGARSILADARSPRMQSILNDRIKFRESFRPFAPAILVHRVADWFEHTRPSPYMSFTVPLRRELRIDSAEAERALTGLDRIGLERSRLPAVTHVDYSARVQTVDATGNPRFFALLEAFEALTGCPVLINTSFNVRGEPIVCTPEDAYRCFMSTGMDHLVIEDCLLAKSAQGSAQ
jgi:carbamoyltransferase